MEEHHHHHNRRRRLDSFSPIQNPTTTFMIMRRSIFTFLRNLQHFTSTPSLLAFPFALSTLLSQHLVSSSPLLPSLQSRLASLFLASGFPPSSDLFPILNLKLTQTILSFVLVLPFATSSLLLSKAAVIRALFRHFTPAADAKQTDPDSSVLSRGTMLGPLLLTQSCNSLVVLSANATCFCLLVASFDVFDMLRLSSSRNGLLILSATGAIGYSIVVANAYVTCNLSLLVSGVEKKGGFGSILKACVVIRGRMGTALSLAVVTNTGLAGVEALFRYRVVRAYNGVVGMSLFVVLEGMFIAYLYAMLVVIDTIVGCVFLRSCTRDYEMDRVENRERDEKSVLGKEIMLECLV